MLNPILTDNIKDKSRQLLAPGDRNSSQLPHTGHHIVDLKEENICKGFLMVNWAQISNQRLAAIANRGLFHTLHFREKPQNELPASCTLFLPPESTLIKGLLVVYFDQGVENYPLVKIQYQLYPHLHSYVLICNFTDQSEQLHNK